MPDGAVVGFGAAGDVVTRGGAGGREVVGLAAVTRVVVGTAVVVGMATAVVVVAGATNARASVPVARTRVLVSSRGARRPVAEAMETVSTSTTSDPTSAMTRGRGTGRILVLSAPSHHGLRPVTAPPLRPGQSLQPSHPAPVGELALQPEHTRGPLMGNARGAVWGRRWGRRWPRSPDGPRSWATTRPRR